MAVRISGGILLTVTLVYALTVVLPAYAHGLHHASDFRANGFYDVPFSWGSNHLFALPLSFIPTVLSIIPGSHIVVIAFLSCALIFPLILDWRSFSAKEKLLWLSIVTGSWLFFYINAEIIDLYRIWFLD